jgi:RNA polymerase sigma-70 factor (ECF subfamily)
LTRRRFRPRSEIVPVESGIDERRAIERAKAGDWDGLHYLYVLYADDVFGYVHSIVRDQYEAEDVTQDVFAKLMRVIDRYEERSTPFAAWIMRVARNATLDHLRSRKRQVPVEEVGVSDGGQQGIALERRECLKEALASLPAEQRKVIVLRHLVGLSPGEIASRLGKTESSVQGLHHRGRASLRAALDRFAIAPQTAAYSVGPPSGSARRSATSAARPDSTSAR